MVRAARVDRPVSGPAGLARRLPPRRWHRRPGPGVEGPSACRFSSGHLTGLSQSARPGTGPLDAVAPPQTPSRARPERGRVLARANRRLAAEEPFLRGKAARLQAPRTRGPTHTASGRKGHSDQSAARNGVPEDGRVPGHEANRRRARTRGWHAGRSSPSPAVPDGDIGARPRPGRRGSPVVGGDCYSDRQLRAMALTRLPIITMASGRSLSAGTSTRSTKVGNNAAPVAASTLTAATMPSSARVTTSCP
jgi:hypothetical protein